MLLTSGAVAAVVLLLLQLTLFCDAKTVRSPCKENTCHLALDDFWQLQDIISSNRLIILDGGIFNVRGNKGFIVIENVSNLTISGREGGSIIQCSSQSTFGLHLKNVTNVSLTGIAMINCASPLISSGLKHKSSLLIESSRIVTLSKVHLQYSGLNKKFQGVFVNMANVVNYHHTLTKRALVANSSSAIVSFNSDIVLISVDIGNSSHSSLLQGGNVDVIEGLTVSNSHLTIRDTNLHIIGSKVLFIGGNGDKSDTGVNITHSNVYITDNSVVQFRKFNFTSLRLTSSSLQINNSTLSFTENTANNGVKIVCLNDSHMNVINGSSLILTNNTLTNGAQMFLCLHSSFNVSDAKMLLGENKCNSSSDLVAAVSTTTIFENRSFVNITGNVLYKNSNVFYHERGLMGIYNSSLVFTNNSAVNLSVELHCLSSSFVISGGRLWSENNVYHSDSGFIVALNTDIRLERGTIINSRHNEIKVSYVSYVQSNSLIVNESSLLISNNLLSESVAFYYRLCNTVIIASELIFKENECKNSSLMQNIYSNVKIEKGSIVNFTHNKVYGIESYTFLHEYSNLTISGSSLLSFKNNLMADKSNGVWSFDSTVVFSTAVLVFQDNTCQHQNILMANVHTTIKFEKRSLINCTQNKLYRFSLIFYNGLETSLSINEGSTVIVKNNILVNVSVALYNVNSSLILSSGKMIFEENMSQSLSNILQTKHSSTTLEKESFFSVTHNKIDGNAMILFMFSFWKTSSDSELLIVDNNSYAMIMSSNLSFCGAVRIANNNISYVGALTFISSTIWFNGSLEVVGNRGKVSGGLQALNSNLYITGRASFADNYASNGGALTLTSSVMYISPNATVDFTRNHAQWLGGAIYVLNPTVKFTITLAGEYGDSDLSVTCSIQVLLDSSSDVCPTFSIIFNQNEAGTAGDALYGGRTLSCSPFHPQSGCSTHSLNSFYIYNPVNDSSYLSNFTSDPTRVCFCENSIPNCFRVSSNITVHPGERFTLSLASVGYGLGTVPGSVVASNTAELSEHSLLGSESEYSQEIKGTQCKDVGYSILSERDREQIALAASEELVVRSLREAQKVVSFEITGKNTASNILSFYDNFFYIPVFVNIDLLPCPVGFQLVRGKCICHQILRENDIHSCSFSNGTALILRPAPYWIGLPNDTNSSILVYPNCPYDYCQSEDMNITAESPNTQCQYQRSGVLCGRCCEGLSMILGSSECKTCSNLYLVSITAFILMGVALITMVTLLNMTVSVGTLNGLILFANILQANKTLFLPPTTSYTNALIAFLSTFIAWLNLDLGIPMCFFNGLTTYIKTWLQFVFPLYILALVGAIIIATKYSTRVTRLFGTNTVSVLATLVLLSYTKILRILITAFSFTTLTGSQGYHSVVWLADGNIMYFELKHVILFLVALLVLLLLGVPYTVTLTAAPWIQRSRFKRVSSLYNRFKPLFDAYMGPYKDSHRYWTGMLLLARVVLIVLFSSIANTNSVAGPQLNLLLLTLSSSALLALTAALRPYKNKLFNALETFYLSILLTFSSSNLYISSIGTGTGPRAYIYIVLVGVCFLVFLGICGGHVWYRVRKARTERRPEPPAEREEDEYYRPLVWQRARIRAEDEEREEVTISTAGDTDTISYGGRRDSLVELIANADIPQ